MPQLWKRVRNLVASRLRELGSSEPTEPWERAFEDVDPVGSTRREEPATLDEGRETPRIRALEILELGPNADRDEIRSAYRRLCKRYHPDRFSRDEAKSLVANELLAEINLAYQILTEGSP